MAKKSNPNGANQYQLDPRQKMCWDYYIDPKSETFSNAYKSAIKAGYTKASSLKITGEPWFVEKVRTLNMLDKAETVLNDMLEMPTEVAEYIRPARSSSGDDEDEEDEEESAPSMYVKTEPALVKIKQDTAKFVAERVGKHKYSIRTELTGPNGGAIEVTAEDKDAANKALKTLIKK